MPVSPFIQSILDARAEDRPVMANKNIEHLVKMIEANSNVITDEVFSGIMAEGGYEALIELKDIYAVRNAVTDIVNGKKAAPGAAGGPVAAVAASTPAAAPAAAAAPAPAAVATAPAPTPAPAAAPAAPAAAIAAGFGGGPAAAAPTPAPAAAAGETRRLIANKDANLTSTAPPEAEPVTAVVDSLPPFPGEPAEEEAPAEEAPAIDVSASTVEPPAPTPEPGAPPAAAAAAPAPEPGAPPAAAAAAPAPAPVEEAKGTKRRGTTTAAPGLVDQLLDKIDELNKQLTTIAAENTKLKAELEEQGSATLKLSAQTQKRLEKLGISAAS